MTFPSSLQNSIAELTRILLDRITMAPRSQLEIFTSSVQRLTKEEASYHSEIKQQTERVQKLEAQEDDDENREYTLNQEVCESLGVLGWYFGHDERAYADTAKSVAPRTRGDEERLTQLEE